MHAEADALDAKLLAADAYGLSWASSCATTRALAAAGEAAGAPRYRSAAAGSESCAPTGAGGSATRTPPANTSSSRKARISFSWNW